MTQYLLETLMWTGALIALVLLLRRRVARHFGAQAAYALWALPVLRLVIPPITLPACWFGLAETAPSLVDSTVIEPAPVLAMNSLAQVGELAPIFPVPVATPVAPVDWVTPLLLVWLVGAGIFLVRRFALYFAMRRELLDGAKPVGEVGRVRLVETAATLGPVAFGVFEKVVALPTGFMAQRDRHKRDLAIAHELAHHARHDLLANVLVQPLFAAHWFNPLGWAGWTALRRDQEAACDARVVALRSRDERAAYAAIIADFATTVGAEPRLALAAPMACPVLGDISIIHRLRSLTMAEISPRRKLAGRALLAGAALALPMTASISYAETRATQAPVVPAPPKAEASSPAAPIAPVRSDNVQPDADAERDIFQGESDVEDATRVERRVVLIERRADGEPGATEDGPISPRIFELKEGNLSHEERARLEADLARLRKDLDENGTLAQELARVRGSMPEVIQACREGQTEVIVSGKTDNGREALFICRSAAINRAEALAARTPTRSARAAIENARRAIQSDRSLSNTQRSEALRSIEQALAGLPSEG